MNSASEHETQHIKKQVSRHVKIAVGLAIGSLLTLWTSQTNFGSHSLNVAMTLGIAIVQAFLVAGFFMHLLSEKKMIYCFLAFTAVFFTALMAMTIWAHLPGNVVHYK